jgi:hypothetical protein
MAPADKKHAHETQALIASSSTKPEPLRYE